MPKGLKILHLTGHCGGGVGTVLLNFLASQSMRLGNSHEVISFDTINESAIRTFESIGVQYYDSCHGQDRLIKERVANADIVLLHWWNHPLITDWMVRSGPIECRMALWSHISGSPEPNTFTSKLFEYPDEFVFTTPLSYFDPEFMGLSENLKAKISAIWSTGGVERLVGYSPEVHDGFNIGYIGNLDFTKIHPNFVEICRMIDFPDVRFTVVGPLNNKLVRMVEDAGLSDRVRFTGFISEDQKWDELCRFDVFGYPLAPHHYGTCDQTLQEAMAVGIVPVVLDNPMESFIVKHGYSGLVARSTSEYVDCLRRLYCDKEFRFRLARQARIQASEEYSLDRMSVSWDKVFMRLMRLEKQKKSWPAQDTGRTLEPYHIFLESLGRHAGVFTEHLSPKRVSRTTAEHQLKSLGSKHNWNSDNKSTVHQYARFFPDDVVLAQWSNIMKGRNDNDI